MIDNAPGEHSRLIDEQLAVPTEIDDQIFYLSAFRFQTPTGVTEHLTLHLGNLTRSASVLLRIHSACIAGDVFGSNECDCEQQLKFALNRIIEEGSGVVVYLTDHEGRGSGSVAKLRAAVSRAEGRSALPPERRSFAVVAVILGRLGVKRVRLLSGSRAKAEALRDGGIEVSQVLSCPPLRTTDKIKRYLRNRASGAAETS